jgi:hypothetical protein
MLVLTTVMTPVKPQTSNFMANKILPKGLQRVMAALLMGFYQVSEVVRT